ncbi:unnamed protein product [Anisakis simplex]|uniref:Apolipoprotein A-I n=1 Tax=Anisakis simplex TaxID=6269 RepID=A0A0M3JNH3_ANISI|nr:unnamed protein product [Anisakis simplex]
MVDQIEENYELVEEAVLTAYDTAQQAVEQAIAAMPKSEFVQKLRQMREGGGDFTKQLTQMFEPVVKLFHTYSVQMKNIKKKIDSL